MQVMGVSGGKHFEAWDKSSMDAISENVSVATIFETDGEIIKLRTIDAGGRVFDEYVQQARLPKKRKCGTCDRFSECRGTGKFELLEAEESARMQGDPLKPANTDGISVIYRSKEPDSGAEKGSVYFSNEDLAGLEKVEIEYSVMRRGELRYETKRGFRLDDLLERAGELPKEPEADQKSTAALILTNSEGRQKILPLYEVMNGRRFGRPSEVVPAIITEEDGGYRIIYGQQNAAQHNGRGWMRDIRQIEIQ